MSTRDLIDMALRNLRKRKLRTALTILGVVIGTTSIVVMISIGIGMNKSFENQIQEWGNLQVIEVYNYNNSGTNTELKLDLPTIESFKTMEHVEVVTPVLNEYMLLTYDKKYVADVNFVGVWPEAMSALGYNVVEGRGLESGDTDVIVVGGTIPQQFYNPKLSWEMRYSTDPPEVDLSSGRVGITYDYNYGTRNADKKIKETKVKVVGMMSESGQSGYSVVVPMETLEKIREEKNKYQNPDGANDNKKKQKVYDNVMVKVDDMEHVMDVQKQIKDMGFTAYSLTDQLESMKETTKMLRIVLGAIGAISMIVAAISITNTMVMAIYERTKEIGIMKVIGASLKDIRRLFLTEAAFIGFAGGVLGSILSLATSKIVNIVAAGQGSTMQSYIPLWLYLSAILFATAVGIAAGFLPAQRAMKLSALTAIKTE